MSRAEIALVLAVVAFVAIISPSAQAQPKRGDAAPTLLGNTLDGTPVRADENSGKVVAITFWASWCAPCRKELGILEAIQNKVGQDQIRVVAVNIEDPLDFVRLARKLSHWKIVISHDDDGKASAAFGVNGIPHFVLVGRDGHILNVHRGYSERHLDQLVKEINGALTAK